MDTIENIFNHRTIRKYKNTPISDDVLNTILEAASRASTTGNMQVYSIIVTKEEERKTRLWELHFKQNMVLQAPVVLTFCADFNRFNTWCKLRKAEPGYDNYLSFFTAAIDALLAAQNAAIASEHFGLGVCYLGTTTYMCDKIIELLECPQGVVPITTLVIGYPDESPELTDRLPLKAIIHEETYSPYTSKQIDEYYKAKEELPFTKKLIEENQLETLAQIFTQKRYSKKDNEYFSGTFMEAIRKQGFLK